MTRIAGLLLILGVGYLGLLFAGDWNTQMPLELIDFPSALWIIFSVTGVILITGEGKTFIVAKNALLSRKYVMTALTKDRAVRLYKLLAKTIWASAVVAVCSGIMYILFQLEDPAALGPMLSVVLTSAFYAAFLNFAFIYPAIYILENRRNVDDIIVISERQVIDKMLELCYRQGINPEEVMNAEEISFRKKG